MSDRSLTIRPATTEDLDAVWAIETAVFAEEAWSRPMMAEELAGPHRSYLVLEDETGAVQGYAGLLAVGAEGDVQTIALAPEVRGAGHGRRLIEALIAQARDKRVRELFLEVRADNPVARSLYESLSFSEIGVRPRYYQPDDVDAIVMKLQIKDQA